MVTTMETGRSMSEKSGAPSARSMLTSFALHVLALVLLMLVPAQALLRSAPPEKNEVDIVFYRPPADRGPRARGPASCAARDERRPGPRREAPAAAR